MEAGLIVFNENGNLQIDSKYKNLALREARPFSLTAPNNSPIDVSLVYTGTAFPVLFLECLGPANFPLALVSVTGSVGALSFNFRGTSVPGQPVNYVAYFFESNITVGNSGLLVYDQNGELVFSSNDDPLKVVLQVSGIVRNDTALAAAIAAAQQPGRRYAICQSRQSYYVGSQSFFPPPNDMYNRFAEASGVYRTPAGLQGLGLRRVFETGPIYPTVGPFVDYVGSWVMADVTGLV